MKVRLANPSDIGAARSATHHNVEAHNPAVPASLIQVAMSATLAIGVFLYQALSLHRPLNVYDEGVAAYNGSRILNGDIPYRDFWTLYAPGQFYVLALLFKVFGTTIFVERLWDVVVRVAIVVLAYCVVKAVSSYKSGLLAGAFVALALVPQGFYYGYAAYPALFFCLLGAFMLVKYCLQKQTNRLFLCGLAIGVATLFRHDFGFYSFASSSFALIVFGFFNGSITLKVKLASILKNHVYFGSGALAVIAPVLAYLLLFVPGEALLTDLVYFPLRMLPRLQGIPYPSLSPGDSFSASSWLTFYLPLWINVVSLVAAIAWLVRGKIDKLDVGRIWGVVVLAPLGLFMFLQAMSRYSGSHSMPASIIALVVLSILFPVALRNVQRPMARRTVWLLLGIISLFWIGYSTWMQVSVAIALENPQCLSSMERSGCISINSDQIEAIRYVQGDTTESERIYVGLEQHDTVLLSNVMFYFLANRHSSTRYHELHPGVTTGAREQAEIISGLEEHNVKYAVLWGPILKDEPNESSISSGVTLLDDFIHRNYTIAAHFGDYTIWERQPK